MNLRKSSKYGEPQIQANNESTDQPFVKLIKVKNKLINSILFMPSTRSHPSIRVNKGNENN